MSKPNLYGRLELLERATVKHDPRTIFFTVVGTTASGWRFDGGEVMRGESETDENLKQRAGHFARSANPGRRILFLNQIEI